MPSLACRWVCTWSSLRESAASLLYYSAMRCWILIGTSYLGLSVEPLFRWVWVHPTWSSPCTSSPVKNWESLVPSGESIPLRVPPSRYPADLSDLVRGQIRTRRLPHGHLSRLSRADRPQASGHPPIQIRRGRQGVRRDPEWKGRGWQGESSRCGTIAE